MSGDLRLLVVDDDAVFRERLARAFAARGCRVAVAGDAETALQQWRAEDFDGAVVDLRLNSTSGLPLVAALREVRTAARLVVLTGFGSIGTAVEAGRLGVAEYFTKPVEVDRLLEVFRDVPTPEASRSASEPEVPSLDRVEWEHIQRVLAECGGNVSRTARLLGIDRRSLQRKLAKYPPRR